MAYPLVCCLCPTYRRPRLLENAIACFLAQDYPAERRRLLILDDAGQIVPQEGDGWRVLSVSSRWPNLPAKYNALAQYAWEWVRPDILAVWEDDDIYLPWHLRVHVEAQKDAAWAKPSTVWSLYTRHLHKEPAAGRFHAALTFTRELLVRIGGWPDTPRGDFDQQFLKQLSVAGPPADPCQLAEPSYIFRWETTGAYHGQAYMRSAEDGTWYDAAARHAPDGLRVTRLVPQMDPETFNVFHTVQPNRIRQG